MSSEQEIKKTPEFGELCYHPPQRPLEDIFDVADQLSETNIQLADWLRAMMRDRKATQAQQIEAGEFLLRLNTLNYRLFSAARKAEAERHRSIVFNSRSLSSKEVSKLQAVGVSRTKPAPGDDDFSNPAFPSEDLFTSEESESSEKE